MPHPSPDEIALQIQHRLMEEIATSEQRYRALIETLRDGVFICDEQGRLSFMNSAMAKLLERPVAILSGQKLSAFAAPEYQAALDRLLNEATSHHCRATAEIRFLLPGGSFLWGLVSIEPPSAGQCAGLVTDITAQKEVQSASEQTVASLTTHLQRQAGEITERRAFEAIQLQQMPIGCICWDTFFRVQSWNPAAERMFGFTEQEMLGREPYGLIVPEDVRPWVAEVWNRLLNGERTVPSVNENLSKDGRRLLCSWSNTPLRNKHGFVIGVLSMVENITSLRKAERDLEIKNSQLQAVSDAIIHYLADGDWNQASSRLLRSALLHTQSQYGFLGVVTPGPILRILCHEGVTWGPENMEFFEAAQRTYQEVGYLEFSSFDNLFGRVITDNCIILSNDPANDPRASHRLPAGHPPLKHFLGVPIRQGKRVVGLLGVANHPRGYSPDDQQLIQTLTQAAGVLYDNYVQRGKAQTLAIEKETLRQELIRAERLASLGTLLGGVAHELNNPLFIAQGYLRLAQENLQEGAADQAAQDLTVLEQTIERASAILTRFLKSTRDGPGAGSRCQVNQVLEDVVKMLSNTLLIAQIRCDVSLSPSLPEALIDSQGLTQVLLNLLTNACQALHGHAGKGTIYLSSRLVNSTHLPLIELTIRDNGPGIDQRHLAHIFDPFFTTKPVGQGTGLGLAICHQIVTDAGGSIACRSTPWQDTTFTVTLKTSAQAAPALPDAGEKESAHG